LEQDLGVQLTQGESDLTGWVSQGVLLLNTVLTVRSGEPLSHRNQGWEIFTDQVISALNSRKAPLVFILWGAHAQKMKVKIDTAKHRIFESVHPSPLSAHRGFFGSKVFSVTNQYLREFGVEPIDWTRISAHK
jgi:uracil-DNA glycosylase